ncbi:DUF6441 family protein [Tranquillimonas rosea]|uniref:DUF6441 family protein n=1 Tax=Tranquillimonas rosea TaxID=641238 RepID=UPI003BA9F891
MKLQVGISGDLRDVMEREVLSSERAVTSGIRAAGRGLKADWRQQVRGAGLGTRLGKSIQARNYPGSGASIGATSLVFTKAPDIVDAFNLGATIRSKDGFWLAIPTEAAVKGRGGKRTTPLDFERRTGLPLRFVYRPGRPGLLVVDQARVNKRGSAARKGGRRRKGDGILTGEQTIVAFILVPQVKLRKRLDLDRDKRRWEGRLPELIVSKWPEAR